MPRVAAQGRTTPPDLGPSFPRGGKAEESGSPGVVLRALRALGRSTLNARRRARYARGMMRLLLVVLMAGAARPAAAAPDDAATLPVSMLSETLAYDALEDAAVAALRSAAAQSEKFEYAGALVRSDAGFFFTEAVTARDEANIRYAIRVPQGFALAGIYHTHPSGDGSEVFSPTDVQQAKSLGLPSFIGVMDDDSVREFEPGMTVWRAPVGSVTDRDGVAYGRVILRRGLRGDRR
jgi:proteasome lid subunit RPN8/RPN11